MDLSSQPNGDEERIMQRQLYRAGESNKPAPKTPAPSSSIKSAAPVPVRNLQKKTSGPTGDKSPKGPGILQRILLLGFGYYLLYGTVEQRRRVFKGLGVAAWLLFLCGASYCVFLPDLKGIAKDMSSRQKAIMEDASLTPDQKREKMRETFSELSKLTPEQRRAVFQISMKERIREGNKKTVDFLKLSKEEQIAEVKRDMEKRRAMWGGRPRNNNNKNNNKGAQRGGGQGGGGPGGRGGGGPPGGGWGGGGGGGSPLGRMADSMSPESRAAGPYRAALMRQLGGFGGGQGGGGRGGAGGPPAGGGGGPR